MKNLFPNLWLKSSENFSKEIQQISQINIDKNRIRLLSIEVEKVTTCHTLVVMNFYHCTVSLFETGILRKILQIL